MPPMPKTTLPTIAPRLALSPASLADQALREELQRMLDQAGRSFRGTATWRYRSFEAAVLAQGGYADLTKPFAGPLLRGPLKACFQNAFEASQHRPDLTYCEGFAMIAEFPLAFHHAWVIDPSGALGEPTWMEPGIAYLGIPFAAPFVAKTMMNRDYYGLLDDHEHRFPLLREGFPDGAILRP